MGGRNQIIRATPTNEYAPKPNKQIRITNMGGRNQIIRANPTNGYAPQVRIRIQIQALGKRISGFGYLDVLLVPPFARVDIT